MKAVIKNLQGLADRFVSDNLGAYAGQLSFFLVLSFIPFFMLIAVGITYIPMNEDVVREVLHDALPADFYAVLLPILRDIFTKKHAFVPLSIIIALWSSGKVVSSMTNGLNIIYQVTETRGYFVNRLRGMLYILIFILAIFLSMIFMVFGNIMQKFLLNLNPNLTGFLGLFKLTGTGRNILTWFVLILVFLVIYKYVPNRHATWNSQLPGAFISATAWILFSWIFSLYVNFYSGLNDMYGSLTTLIFFLTWLYFCMWIIMIGAELNSYYEAKIRKLQRAARARISGIPDRQEKKKQNKQELNKAEIRKNRIKRRKKRK